MIREVTVIIHVDGRLELIGHDLPDLEDLEALVGTQEIDKLLRQLGLNIEINSHLCG